VKTKLTGAGKKIWKDFLAFTPGQKAVTIAAVLALVIGGYLFSSYASRPSYAPLFTNLAASDAAAIVDKLQAQNKPYKLSEGGTAIMVPSKDVYAERLTMSAAGLPSSGQTGYSLLDKEGITTSEFKQHVDYQRALEGELANTISSISGVSAAQVHLALPTEDVFSDDSQKTTAAVLVTTTPGDDMSADQVRSIVNLVSSSVPGLTADQVTVSDSNGQVLAAAGSGITAGGSSSQDEATQKYDTKQAAAVQAMLDKLVGTGHAVVTVNATLDFDSSTTTSKTYSYDKTVPPLSETTTKESYGNTNGTNGTGGTLGSQGTSAPASSTNVPYSKESDTKDNSVNQTDETRVAAPGAVKRQGVSVLLDDAAASKLDQEQIKALVSSAVSLDPKRGDTLAIASMPFDTSSAKAAADAAAAAKKQAASAASQAKLMSMVKTGGVIIAVIAVIVVTLIMSRRKKDTAADESPMPDDLEELLAALNERAGDEKVPNEPALRKISDSDETQAQRRAIAELADEQPDDMARLLRTWLNTKDS
jgi:flagellar M-ring protein FliF